MNKAPVNKILEHSMVDGPGNRTAIFFQECNLSCSYCHNPETQRLCIGCGACVQECPAGALSLQEGKTIWEPKLCTGCDHCIQICPNYSSPKVTEMTADEIFERVLHSIPFIRGITVSGGECSLRLDFLQELFLKCRAAGLTCLMDCNGTIPVWEHPVMKVCDGVMLDVKAWDDACFRRLTGEHAHMVKENLKHLSRMQKLSELRIVCLQSVVDAEAVICGIAEAVSEETREHTLLKLIRFRNVGVKGKLKKQPSPSMEYMKGLQRLAMEKGFGKVRIV